MEKRVLGAGLWHSPSPSCACLGPSSLLTSSLLASQSNWKSSPSPCNTAQNARSLLIAGRLLQRAPSLVVITFQLSFWCCFLEKKPWEVSSTTRLLFLWPLLPAPLELLVLLVPTHWDNWCGGSRSCHPIVSVALKMCSFPWGKSRVFAPRSPLPSPASAPQPPRMSPC